MCGGVLVVEHRHRPQRFVSRIGGRMHHPRKPHVAWLAGAALVALAACESSPTPASPMAARALAAASAADLGRAGDPNLRQLDHIVVIYLENRSFDNLYG